ncbi:MAG: hypothetical protein QQN41_09340 [Nitrosopumilus sp.]
MAIATTPTVPIKRYARGILQERGENSNLVGAVCAYIDAQYYINNRIGDPDYHNSIAAKVIGKLGLAKTETGRAYGLAQSLYQAYEDAPKKMVRGKLVVINEEQEKKARIYAKKVTLRNRFQKLMSYSDDKLRILNSNKRIDFSQDIVYKNADTETRRRIINRTLTSEEYKNLETKILESQDKFSLNLSQVNYPENLILYAKNIMYNKTPAIKSRVDDWELFTGYVLDLLNGKSCSKSELEAKGINPDDIKKQAHLTVSQYTIHQRDEIWKRKHPNRRHHPAVLNANSK